MTQETTEARAKRYLLFTFAEGFAAGGWHDFAGFFQTRQEAVTAAEAYLHCDRYQVVDGITGEVVAELLGEGVR